MLVTKIRARDWKVRQRLQPNQLNHIITPNIKYLGSCIVYL